MSAPREGVGAPGEPDARAAAREERAVRRGKRDRLRELGIDPYPPRSNRTHTCVAAKALYQEPAGDAASAFREAGEKVRVAGRVRGLRDHGKTWFATIGDETGTIQLFLKKDLLGDRFPLVKLLDLGDFLAAEGPVFKTRMGEISVEAHGVAILSKAIEPPPDKWHGLADVELRCRRRYLDLVANPPVRGTFRARIRMVAAIRAFLAGRGFMEVETPMMQPLAGGAAARPFITHHNTLGIDLFLRIAPELYLKRLLVGGFERVFEMNRNFRNEGMDRNHNPEFTMLEAYQAYGDVNDMMELTESLIHDACAVLRRDPPVDFDPSVVPDFPPPPWPRVPFLEAIAAGGGPELVAGDASAAQEAVDRHGLAIEPASEGAAPDYAACLEALFDRFAEPKLEGPVFVVDYPTVLSPLAKRKPGVPELTERFELYIRGMEIANAFSELNDPDDQEARFREQGGTIDMDYVMALRAGMPPAGGLGIGIDRLAMLLTGSRTIRDVILFPAMRPEEVTEAAPGAAPEGEPAGGRPDGGEPAA